MIEPPYPGLRPFQPDDSEYFFGREQPVRDVVRRLRAERFVAVIGGSGSGKSSLVLAGAIPRLRSFAIREAGDFWIPIVSTPGTNPAEGETPLYRLARKFCAVLRAPENESEDQRLEACVRLLSEHGGLGRLIDRYGAQVQDLDGVDPENLKVNYLFLIDQFEELFHRSNRAKNVEDDCARLVDRIVEQSKPDHRHAQVCVALTMRSEHLNDCPRYAGLPDAINRAFYLVRRLDDEQSVHAIQQPALRFLRKCMAAERQQKRESAARGEALVGIEWPASVSFAPELIERLLCDARAVLGDEEHADHLPLLQHLLFWIWDAACKRCADSQVPDSLTLDDLQCAVNPRLDTAATGNHLPLSDDTNVLKACLENRCEYVYKHHEERREAWELIFRSLAFKEPNTGMYTQQRASMKNLRDQLEPSETGQDALYQLLQPWLNPHEYLHWDTESATVKVTHEALIRRWARFRAWADEDDRQFQMYLRLLYECREWSASGEAKDRLAVGNALLLYENAKLLEALSDPKKEEHLRRLLAMDREGGKLAPSSDRAIAFLTASRAYHKVAKEREVEQERRVAYAQRRYRQQLSIAAGLVGMALVLTIMWFSLSGVSQKELTLHRGYALAAETQASIRTQIGEYDQPQFALRSSLQAAQFFVDGRARETFAARAVNFVPIFDWFGPRLRALRNAELLAEARVTAGLRNSLVGFPWLMSASPARALDPPSFFDCENGNSFDMDAAKYFKVPESGNGYGLVLASKKSWGFSIHTATLSNDGANNCTIGDAFFAIPNSAGIKAVGIDSLLRNIVLFFDKYTQYHVVNWDEPQRPHMVQRAVVSVSEMVNGIHGLPSRRDGFATDVKVGKHTVRLFDITASSLDEEIVAGSPRLTLFDGMMDDTICSAFAKDTKARLNGSRVYGIDPFTENRTSRAICVFVTNRPIGTRSEYYGEVFVFSDRDAAKDGVKRLPVFEEIIFGQNAPVELRVNVDAGWLAFRTQEGGPWRGIPWTLGAWRAQANHVFRPMAADSYEPSRLPALSRPYLLIMSDVESRPPRELLKSHLP